MQNAINSKLQQTALEQLAWTRNRSCSDFAKLPHGVMTTPALVVDGKVVSYGKVLRLMNRKDSAKIRG